MNTPDQGWMHRSVGLGTWAADTPAGFSGSQTDRAKQVTSRGSRQALPGTVASRCHLVRVKQDGEPQAASANRNRTGS